MIQDKVHRQIVANLDKVEAWFERESNGLFFPFYSSFDIRDSGEKVAPVDANIFPAGFNNICPTDLEAAIEIVTNYFSTHFPDVRKVILLTEEHTNNPYYWDNVATLITLLKNAGLEIRAAIPRILPEPLNLTSASGKKVELFGAERDGDGATAGGMKADLIISNNDFSEAYQEWISGLKTPINPPHELGWHRRRKDAFFKEYNQLASEFCRLIDIDPWKLSVSTTLFDNFDVGDEASRNRLAEAVDEAVGKIKKEYAERKVAAEPFVFIKNNAGTYGLGVTQANHGNEVREWSYKLRKKMKAAKGGRAVEQVIVQEGIPSIVTAEGATAEPTVYMIGCQLAGGFLRAHESKGPRESLNSPGAVYRRMCVSDLKVSVEGNPLENVYGWVARLGFLATAKEAKNLAIGCTRYKFGATGLT